MLKVLAGGSGRLAPYLYGLRSKLVLLLGASLVCSVAESALPYLLGVALSSSQPWAILALGGVVASSIGANVWRHVTGQFTKVELALDVRTDLAVRVGRSTSAAAAQMSPSEIATVVATDVDRFTNFPVLAVRFVAHCCAFLLVAAYLLVTSPLLGAVVLVGVPCVLGLNALLASPLESRQERQRDSLDAVTALSADLGAGLRVILGLRAAAYIRQRFRAVSEITRDAGLASARLEAAVLMVSVVVPGLLTLALVLVGVGLVQAAQMRPTDLIIFYAAAAYLVIPLEAFGNLLSARGRARASARRLSALLTISSPQTIVAGTDLCPSAINGELIDPGSGISVPARGAARIAASRGEADDRVRTLTGIDQESAAEAGSCRIADLPEATRAELTRGLFSAPYLFSGTMRELLDPRETATDTQLLAALKVAEATDIVGRLPAELDEPIGSNARSFSGGERQRLALARVLVGNPRFLVVVDPTRALDTLTAQAVLHNLDAARAEVGTLTIDTTTGALPQGGANG